MEAVPQSVASMTPLSRAEYTSPPGMVTTAAPRRLCRSACMPWGTNLDALEIFYFGQRHFGRHRLDAPPGHAHAIGSEGRVQFAQQFQATPVVKESIGFPRGLVGQDEVRKRRKGRVLAGPVARPLVHGLNDVVLEGVERLVGGNDGPGRVRDDLKSAVRGGLHPRAEIHKSLVRHFGGAPQRLGFPCRGGFRRHGSRPHHENDCQRGSDEQRNTLTPIIPS